MVYAEKNNHCKFVNHGTAQLKPSAPSSGHSFLLMRSKEAKWLDFRENQVIYIIQTKHEEHESQPGLLAL